MKRDIAYNISTVYGPVCRVRVAVLRAMAANGVGVCWTEVERSLSLPNWQTTTCVLARKYFLLSVEAKFKINCLKDTL